MRWQDRSVQFEEPQFFSWKIPSLDQIRDRTTQFDRGANLIKPARKRQGV